MKATWQWNTVIWLVGSKWGVWIIWVWSLHIWLSSCNGKRKVKNVSRTGWLKPSFVLQPHTILLIQPTRAHETRTYTDYETLDECLEGYLVGGELCTRAVLYRRFLRSFLSGICKIYEEHLRQLHPSSPSITYDISELFKFVDSLHDLICLMWVAKLAINVRRSYPLNAKRSETLASNEWD